MKFSEKIVVLRKKYGLNQSKFAEGIGVSRQAVYKWECGQSYPEVAKLLEIKLQYNISIDDLLDDNYDIPLPEKKKRKRISKAEAEKIREEVAAEAAQEPIVPAAEAAQEPIAPATEPAPEPVVKEEPKPEPKPAPKPAPEAEKAPAEENTVSTNAYTREEKINLFDKLFGKKS